MAETGREQTLSRALDVVSHRGNRQNGDPGPHFVKLAQLWSAYLGREIGPQDVAVLLMLLKISRVSRSPAAFDHWVDICGYAACGYESVLYAEEQGIEIRPLDGANAWQHLGEKNERSDQ